MSSDKLKTHKEPHADSHTEARPVDTINQQLARQLIKRSTTKAEFPPGSVPFHVPHRNCLTKQVFSTIERNDIERNLICNLRGTDWDTAKEEKVEVKKRAKAPRKAGFGGGQDRTAKKGHGIGDMFADQGAASKGRRPPELVDLDQLMLRISQVQDNSFIYLAYAVPHNSEFFSAYALAEVPYAKINKAYFFTVSRHGVTLFSRRETLFTSLPVWRHEYRQYQMLKRVPLFGKFRLWKGFKVWQKGVVWRRYAATRLYVLDHCFLANESLARAILVLRAECCDWVQMSMVDVSPDEAQHLFYFIEANMLTYEFARDRLQEYRAKILAVMYDACYDAIVARGFYPHDEALEYLTLRKMREMMSYTERSRKLRFCILLTNFLAYCDYMTISFLHLIIRDAFEKLANLFRLHDACTPTEEMLMADEAIDRQIEDERPENTPKRPLFVGDLLMRPERIEVDPAIFCMLHIVHQFDDLITAAVYDVKRFHGDPKFVQFTTPSIRGRQEERLGGQTPTLAKVLEDDDRMVDNSALLSSAVVRAYDTVLLYVKRFDVVVQNYKIDVATDPKTIRAQRDVAVLRKYCERYTEGIRALDGIESCIKLGLLELKQGSFAEEAVPVCQDLLTVMDTHLPKLSIDKLAELVERAFALSLKLDTKPTDLDGFVNFIYYFEECEKQIDDMATEIDYVFECFKLLQDYNLRLDDSAKEDFMDCEDNIIGCREKLKACIENKPQLIEKMNECLQDNLKQLFEDIEEVRIESQKEYLIDETADRAQIDETLAKLNAKVADCTARKQNFVKLQREFKLGFARYDALDKITNEVRYRQMLWDTADEWKACDKLWHEQPFNELDVVELGDTSQRLQKTVGILERNLPPCSLVPRLKTELDAFREKMPIITCLRNPAIRTRHWLKIEQIIDRKVFQVEHTLELYEEAGALVQVPVLGDGDTIAEVSAQASAEQALETILKKVEMLWKEMDLCVVAHRDAKDVYILAGLDELQLALDESNVNINTIAASRHCGPIRGRVEDWQRQLDMFANTMEEWTTCQTTWIYLEAIFSAPDIQRQLPKEARLFMQVDKVWKDVMRRCYKQPLALPQMTDPDTYKAMKLNNEMLDVISKKLEEYLEMKRTAFPRFFFLSNDELLEILAQTRNPHAVQPHLRKCFDAIALLQFGVKESTGGGPAGDGTRTSIRQEQTNDILAILSPEGECIKLAAGLKARGPVEDWLGKVEEAMFTALKRCMKFGYRCFPSKERPEWMQEHPNQVVLTVSQQQWAVCVHAIFDEKKTSDRLTKMQQFEKRQIHDLAQLAAIARTDISRLLRRVLCALITIDVHARDTITALVVNEVTDPQDFNWLRMIRYYWMPQSETMSAQMSAATLPYNYEYIGADGVLVITPLTDRCYLCLMGALQMDLGGAPAGPAGTGKTETTKDLAKALAKQCVVFNCSDGLDYKMMGRFFSGLAQCGAWCCFDEFNRIDIEVLSVIAQQLITIRQAKVMDQRRFMFEGRMIKLNKTCAAFITMNPGYAGRTELPDNLKSLFRPVSMMVPDYTLIAEVILYSEGFESSKGLAKKMVHMYKLCSEQLSQQDHYDFGMRAVKSVLVMAGALKRAMPDQREDITLIQALRDSNLPKFLRDDAVLFAGIIADLFPGVALPKEVSDDLMDAIKFCMVEARLQPIATMCRKVVQLYETMRVRWGVMLVGPTGGGKTRVLHCLAKALSKLYDDGVPGAQFRNVAMKTMNPKAISADELYGAVNKSTLEWKDGLLGLAVRHAVIVTIEEHQWIVCDGPVDAVWIENLNTVLDDNKMLCLANSERIKLTAWVHMVFEVQDLAQASPATVSRCGMVYIDPFELGWLPLTDSWRETELARESFGEDLLDHLNELFHAYVDEILNFARRNCKYFIHQVEVSKISMMCELLETHGQAVRRKHALADVTKEFVSKLFVWAVLWAVGGNVDGPSRQKLQQSVREVCSKDVELPEGDLWNWKINVTALEWEPWSSIVEKFTFDPDKPFSDCMVPTVDTAAFGYIAETLFQHNRPVMFTGDTGVGKSALARGSLQRLCKSGDIISVVLNFSAQTSSLAAQDMLESRLEKRRRTLLGPPIGKRLIAFVDDVNMPKLDTYGSQPPIELLRQVLDFSGLYDRDKMFWKGIENLVMGCACAPPGGGRNALTPRFVRHFALLQLGQPSPDTLHYIFGAIMTGFLEDFNETMRPLAKPVVSSAVEIYCRIARELLPTPEKSHYVFNLRDLSKCIAGVLQANAGTYSMPAQLIRLFHHESLRVFNDRLINDADRELFATMLTETSAQFFPIQAVKPGEQLIFGDFINFGQPREDRLYEEIADMKALLRILTEYMEDWNSSSGQDIQLILFSDAVQHVTRLARLLRSERANGLLVGLSGMGKQSLTRLASHINTYGYMQIVLSRGYDTSSFREDLRKLYWRAGVENKPTVFLMADTQIVQEEFLEDVNNILNSGEVPGLYEGDEYERVLLGIRDAALAEKLADMSRDSLFGFFIQRACRSLHVVLCMSPIGGAFRRRCRMFPSLVNCCTIDWFVKWPPDALYTVATGSFSASEMERTPEDVHKLSETCVMMHATVEVAAERLYAEYRRHYYTTPSSFLELLKLYEDLLRKRIEVITGKRARLANGLKKILDTNKMVDVMKKELDKMAPDLDRQQKGMTAMLTKLAAENKTADTFKKQVSIDEADASAKAKESQGVADEANADLAVAKPALQAAEDALKSINKKDIMELKSFAQPPALVKFVMEAVCVLFGTKPSWEASKKILSDVNFLKKLMEFDKEHLSEAVLLKLKPFITSPDWNPAKIEKVSMVAKSVSLWVVAMDQFAKIYKDVLPKINRAKEAETELKGIMAILKEKQGQLAEVEAKLQGLRDTLDEKNALFKLVQDKVDLTSARLNRAGRLTSALSDEEVRWAKICEELTKDLGALPGDCLIAAANVSYLGAFPVAYRRELCSEWVNKCRSLKIPSSKEFGLVAVLGEQYEIRMWNMCELPRDEVSVENGIVVTKALRWPLMIDPQEQANRWIRAMETPNGLMVGKLTDSTLMRTLEICIRQGFPFLIEEVEESIDPALAPVLSRNFNMSTGSPTIKLGDTDVDYNTNFRLYMTTKLSNPHYLPEICVSVTLVNFLVTASGLEDQLLAEVVAIELPALELQRSNLIVRINEDRQQLLMLEDRVLKLLFNATGNILDDEELVETLNDSKETSAIIATRLIDTEETEVMITNTRNKYRHLATRGAVLYFNVATLAEIDPMYQYSLKYFSAVFCAVVAEPQPPLDLPERLAYLLAATVYAVYRSVARGLFERHKMMFALQLAMAIERQEERLKAFEQDIFLRGTKPPSAGAPAPPPKPLTVEMTDAQWLIAVYLEKHIPEFQGLLADLSTCRFPVSIGKNDFSDSVDFCIKSARAKSEITRKWKSFHHMLFVRLLKPQVGTAAMSAYVRDMLDDRFTDSSGASSTLAALSVDTSPTVPLVFILSTGSDPMAALIKYVGEQDRLERFAAISLGQGQGVAAERLITKSRQLGHWVFLQNCHLATSWMPQLALIVRQLALGQMLAHADFRLYLSAMPTASFPVSVLQNSVKVTNEPPRGLRATLVRAFDNMNQQFFEDHVLKDRWRRMVFGLCLFHGVVLERRRFGPLGWNITYEFSETDRECGLATLDVYCDRKKKNKAIPWQALEYINAEVTWGGRVTDRWDQRCLRYILLQFVSEPAMSPSYMYSASGVYRCPEGESVSVYREYAAQLTENDAPEIFGMHENANLVYQAKETQFVLDTILEGQPRQSGASGGGDGGTEQVNEMVIGMIKQIAGTIVRKISADNAYPPQMQPDEGGRMPSLTTVLLQETDRYNRMLGHVHDTLVQLERAIRGLVVMSEQLESLFAAMVTNRVPALWAHKGFLSTKSLASWVRDFQLRCEFIQSWMNDGISPSTWLSGLFFPQSFLTGTMQTHSRLSGEAIDGLLLDFEILPIILSQEEVFEGRAAHRKVASVFKGIEQPEFGVCVHGMFIEAGRYDGGLLDSLPGQLTSPLPVMWIKPCTSVTVGDRYESPMYKTQVRAGVLSTTGHSTNFVMSVYLKSKLPSSFWILRGTALVTGLTD